MIEEEEEAEHAYLLLKDQLRQTEAQLREERGVSIYLRDNVAMHYYHRLTSMHLYSRIGPTWCRWKNNWMELKK